MFDCDLEQLLYFMYKHCIVEGYLILWLFVWTNRSVVVILLMDEIFIQYVLQFWLILIIY